MTSPVGWSVGQLVGWSSVIKGGKYHLKAPIGELISLRVDNFYDSFEAETKIPEEKEENGVKHRYSLRNNIFLTISPRTQSTNKLELPLQIVMVGWLGMDVTNPEMFCIEFELKSLLKIHEH